MLELGPVVFASPWMLTALATLPVLWWLLRVTPPAPLVRAFPPLRLILALRKQEETPARTPLWLILLRMLIAALVILALAHPLLNPGARLAGSGPLILVVDDGWAAAPRWAERETALGALIDRADRAGRPVRLLTTAPNRPGEPVAVSGLLRPAEARRIAKALKPKPWPSDRAAARAAANEIAVEGSAHAVWLSDGIADAAAEGLAQRLQQFGSLQVYLDGEPSRARLLRAPKAESEGLAVPVERVGTRGEAKLTLRFSADDGRLLGREDARFAAGENRTKVHFRLPGDMRNAAARVEIEGEASAGAVFLMDERWRRRPVGVISGSTSVEAQPLLAEDYYVVRALQPFSDVHRGTIADLLQRELAVIVLADVGKLSNHETEVLTQWMTKGGVVLRFAGPRLAQTADGLIPVRLRGGERAMGGALSWTRPARLLPFDDASPFAGLAVPDDVRIRQQVLAEPTVDLNDKTWARLSDGTPLVTAEKREHGWLILVHTTANTDWSNLPLSGLFIDMLRRVVDLSAGVAGDDAQATFPPLETMDGFGVLARPPATATAISGRGFSQAKPGPATPPGYYGRGEARRALNLAAGVPTLAPLGPLPGGVGTTGYESERGFDAMPWLLLAALLLALVDLVISYALRGLGTGRAPLRRGATAALVIAALAAFAAPGGPAGAQTADPGQEDVFAIKATSETRIAYVLTGNPAVDTVSRAGLIGLGSLLRQRTAVEPGEPMGVDVERDELAFFPVLYWPLSSAQRPLSDGATEKLNQYLRGGGTILFDTREQENVAFDPFGTGGAASARLRMVLQGLDVPALIPVPTDHVLTKSFYLLSDFPGRWTGGTVWVERRGGRHNDGVSTVIIGGNDWAGAWAINADGAPMLPVAPGGERQREMAYRFGINWMMYALTGNYKTDQVHVPAIIERLGQ